MKLTRKPPCLSTVRRPFHSLPIRPSSGFGIQPGQYTGAPIWRASFVQPACHAVGHDGADDARAAGAAELPQAVRNSEAAAASTTRAVFTRSGYRRIHDAHDLRAPALDAEDRDRGRPRVAVTIERERPDQTLRLMRSKHGPRPLCA